MIVNEFMDRQVSLEAAKTHALDLARLGSEQQANNFQSAQDVLSVLQRLPELSNGDGPRCHAIIDTLAVQYPQFVSIGIVDSAGIIVCINLNITKMHFIDMNYFNKIINSTEKTIKLSKFIIGPVTGKPIVVAAVPLLPTTADKASPGIAYVTLNLDWVTEHALNFAGSKDTTLSMIDLRTSTLLVHSSHDKTLTGKTLKDSPLILAMRAHPTGGTIEAIDFDGTAKIFGFAPLADRADHGIMIAVGLSRTAILTDVNGRLLLGVSFALFAALLAGGCAWLLGDRTHFRAIQSLVETAKKLGAGHLDARAKIAPWHAPEFRMLGQVLGEMADDIAAAQSRLRDSESQFRLLAENSTDMILRVRFDGKRIYASPACRRLLGWEPEDMLRMTTQESVHPDDIGFLDRLGADKDQPDLITYRMLCKDGNYIWVEGTVRTMPHIHERIPERIVVVRNIERRLEAERKLKDSEARYRLLAEHSTDMIFQLDSAMVRRYVSPSSRDVLGFEPEELMGMKPVGMVHPDDAARVAQVFQSLIDGRLERASVIDRIRHRSGQYLWVEAHLKGLKDANTGTVTGIIGALRDISARKSAEDKLEHANRWLLMTEEVAHVGHWRVEFPRNDLTWSDEVYRIHGLDKASFIPDVTKAINCYHPDDKAEINRIFSNAVENQQNFEFRLRIVRPDNTIRYVLSRGVCERDATTGELQAVFGTVMDVTDLTISERRLADKSTSLQLTLDTMDQGLLKISVDGTIKFANRRYAELLDLPIAMLAKPKLQWCEVLAYLDRRGEFEMMDEKCRRRIKEAPLTPGKFERTRPNGQILEVYVAQVPNGSVIVTYTDITARRIAEQALQESEKKYRIIAETTSDIIIQHDIKLIIQYISPACVRILGYEPHEMMNTDGVNLVHPEDWTDIHALSLELVAGKVEGDHAVPAYRMLHKQGHWIWVETSMRLIRNEQTGAPLSLICSMRDVTERQRAARHLQRAKAVAEQAARIKAEFLANMSHELRTPLTGMLGVHDILRSEPTLNDAHRRLLGLASESGYALLTIVNDILDFSKIEAGQLTIESVPFSVRNVIESCRNLTAEGLRGKPISIEATFAPPEIDGLLGDPTRLRQILLNLLTNAVKFTERGRIAIDLTYLEEKTLRIEVTDTGIGIPHEKMHLLFERFAQADTSVTRRYGGTGLGLAICKRLVDLMGGRIGVESAPEEGSKFWFELPLLRHESADIEPALNAVRPMRSTSRRILLAEDNVINGEIIANMLSNRGHVVTVVLDGKAAVQAAQADIDVILMDLQMPVMDGLAATAAIRRQELAQNRSRRPIIGLTANAMVEDIEHCIRVGMDAHIAKPIAWHELFSAIDIVLSNTPEPLDSTKRDGIDAQILDESMLATLADMIGRERIASILSRFVADLHKRMLVLEDADLAEVAAQTHSLASIAGQLGFVQLCNVCMEMEHEIREKGSRNSLSALHEAGRRALSAAAACEYAHVA